MRLTIRNIQEFLRPEYFVLFAVDGFTAQVSASALHYSDPRNDHGPWRKAEVRYLSQTYTPLNLYAEDKKDLLNTVYRYVPLDIVCNMFNEHKGLDVERVKTQI